MPIHFSPAELQSRRARAQTAMAEAGLDALLIFRQESMYYLTGYDTFGYVYFQCLVLTADGGMTLLTRAPDRRQAAFTSVIEDVRVWVDADGADPITGDLRAILSEHGLAGLRLGVEWNAYGLPAALGFRLRDFLDGFAGHADASELVSRLRLVKSTAEITYLEHAAALADKAYDAAVQATHAGAFEGDILAELQGAVWRGGGDDPANEHIIGSGPGALMCRYYSGRRHLDAEDQLTLEFAGTYRHYHACLMRTIRIGKPPARQIAMHDAAVDALEAAKSALVPGRPIGEVFDAHARVLDQAGLAPHRLNACGYSMGAVFAPNWMDWPMFYHGNPVLAAPGQVYFIHIIVFDSDAGLAASSGQTVAVTERGCRPLTHAPLHFVVK
ncbi:MAG: Xaa-Pro peptidase family protein [Azospirillaceae bacterium]